MVISKYRPLSLSVYISNKVIEYEIFYIPTFAFLIIHNGLFVFIRAHGDHKSITTNHLSSNISVPILICRFKNICFKKIVSEILNYWHLKPILNNRFEFPTPEYKLNWLFLYRNPGFKYFWCTNTNKKLSDLVRRIINFMYVENCVCVYI